MLLSTLFFLKMSIYQFVNLQTICCFDELLSSQTPFVRFVRLSDEGCLDEKIRTVYLRTNGSYV